MIISMASVMESINITIAMKRPSNHFTGTFNIKNILFFKSDRKEITNIKIEINKTKQTKNVRAKKAQIGLNNRRGNLLSIKRLTVMLL